jgi:hypothetical protein
MVPPISEWEFKSASKSLNSKSAPGNDGISADLILCSLPVIKPLLFKILNACLFLSLFPNNWKLSKVVVIGKPNKPDYSTLNSFRPINLVLNLAKLLEIAILGHLIWYSRSLNWISDFQHGFREGKSTESAAHSLTSFIESAFEERKVCAAAFLDIKSAFDSALHPAINRETFLPQLPHKNCAELSLQQSCCHIGPVLHFLQISLSRMSERRSAIPILV